MVLSISLLVILLIFGCNLYINYKMSNYEKEKCKTEYGLPSAPEGYAFRIYENGICVIHESEGTM